MKIIPVPHLLREPEYPQGYPLLNAAADIHKTVLKWGTRNLSCLSLYPSMHQEQSEAPRFENTLEYPSRMESIHSHAN